MEKIIRVMIVDDHEVVRIGLRSLLSMFQHIDVVAEASTAEEGIRYALQEKPDVILMDIRLSGKSGIDACREIKAVLPQSHLLMLTSYESKEYVQKAMSAGASGYVLKEASSQGLVQAIESVFRGKKMLDQSIMTKIVHNIHEVSKEEGLLADLNPVEKQILKYIGLGKTNKEIAFFMELREKTVRNYVSKLFAKLCLNNRIGAAAFAVRFNLDSQ